MAQSLATAKTEPVKGGQKPEYSVYIYHHAANAIEGWGDWEKRTVTKDLRVALREAESLYASREFHKVEVKEKSYDARKDHFVDRTLKIYADYKASLDREMIKAALASGVVLTLAFAAVKLIERLF